VNFVRGINGSKSGDMDALASSVANLGREVFIIEYPVTRWWEAWSRQLQFDVAEVIVDATQDGQDIAGHSFGCLGIHRAMEEGRIFNHVTYLGPAMNRDFRFPDGKAARVDVFYNPMDKAVLAGKMIPFHDIGDMGVSGSDWEHIDPRVHNHASPHHRRGTNNHGFYIHGDELQEYAQFIAHG